MSQRTQVKVNLDAGVLDAVDRARGDSSRSAEVERRLAASYGVSVGDRPSRRQTPADPDDGQDDDEAERDEHGFVRVNGFWWVNLDDPVARAQAVVAWAGQDRGKTPSPLPFSAAAGEDPLAADVEGNFPTDEQMWAWVDSRVAA